MSITFANLGWSFTSLPPHAQFIVPNPAKGEPRFVEPLGKVSAKFKENFPERRFLIIEFDRDRIDPRGKLSREELLNLQGALHADLKQYAPLAMLVYSGGESIHGWYPTANGGDEETVLKFLRYACRLGADHTLCSKCQFTRMPGGRHENGQRQTVLFFDPEQL